MSSNYWIKLYHETLDDPKDYKRMCRSCHWKFDGTHRNLGKYAKKAGGKTKTKETILRRN